MAESRYTILVCDDSPELVSGITRLLRKVGYDVLEAFDGEQAIQLLKVREVDAMLLDLQMPNIDGFGVLDYVQEHRQSLPVILMSGMTPGEIRRGTGGLKTHTLPPLFFKPVNYNQVLDILELQLAGKMPPLAGGQ
ncbi:MAG: response regulator [Phycisphaerae bacterium]